MKMKENYPQQEEIKLHKAKAKNNQSKVVKRKASESSSDDEIEVAQKKLSVRHKLEDIVSDDELYDIDINDYVDQIKVDLKLENKNLKDIKTQYGKVINYKMPFLYTQNKHEELCNEFVSFCQLENLNAKEFLSIKLGKAEVSLLYPDLAAIVGMQVENQRHEMQINKVAKKYSL